MAMSAPTDGLSAHGHEKFLRRIEELDAFFAERSRDGCLRIGPEDPDVRRLIEVMAYSSSKAEEAIDRAMSSAVLRMAGETLDELCSLAPAAGLMEVSPEVGAAPVTIARGALVRVVQGVPGDRRTERVSLFSTLDALALMPIKRGAVVARDVWGEPEIELSLRVGCEQSKPFELTFHLHRLSDYGASCALLSTLKRLVKSVRVSVGGAPPEPVTYTFGLPPDERSGLLRVRDFLHFPEQTLCVRVMIPPCKLDGEVKIHFDLRAPWPAAIPIDNHSFKLFVVPIANVWPDLASPIVHEGKRDGYPLRIGAARESAELVRVTGVFEVGPRETKAVLPMSIALSRQGYELVRTRDGGASLRLRLPTQTPRRIAVDALWSQPALWHDPPTAVSLSFQGAAVKGSLRLLGPMRRPARSPLAEDPERMLDLIAARSRWALSEEDLRCVWELMGASGDSPFRGVPSYLGGVEVRSAHDPTEGAGPMVREYRLKWRPAPQNVQALLPEFTGWTESLLDALSETPVRVLAEGFNPQASVK